MKYIMFKDSLGRSLPVIFPDHFIHSEFAKFVEAYVRVFNTCHSFPISAGFVEVTAVCKGKSETLGLQSAPNDDLIISFHDSIGAMSLEHLPPAILKELRQRLDDILGKEMAQTTTFKTKEELEKNGTIENFQKVGFADNYYEQTK